MKIIVSCSPSLDNLAELLACLKLYEEDETGFTFLNKTQKHIVNVLVLLL